MSDWIKWDEQKPGDREEFDIITMPTKAKLQRNDIDGFRLVGCQMYQGKCAWFKYKPGTDEMIKFMDWEAEKGPILYWRTRDIPEGMKVPDLTM